MTSRRHLSTLVLIWSLVGIAAIVGGWLAVAGRLPDPIAVHWSGMEPDGSLSQIGWLAVMLGMLALGGLIAGIAVASTPDWGYRATRRGFLAGILAWGGFTLGVHASVLLANLDNFYWQDARTSLLAIPLVLIPSAIGFLAGWFLAGNSDQPRKSTPIPSVTLDSGDRAAWATRVAVKWARYAFIAVAVLTVVTAALAGAGFAQVPWVTPIALAIVSAAGVTLTSISISIGARGVMVRFGVIGWPVWRIKLSDIDSASVEDRQALEVGGWGLRITPYGTALMLRSGECLVIKRHRKKNVFISVDDAASAAALLNALVERDAVAAGN